MKISFIDQALAVREAEEGLAQQHEQDLAHQDLDADGVSDETEGWLGTSTNTDETGPNGRTDAGYLARTDAVDRERREDRTLQAYAAGAPDDTSVELRVLERGARKLEGSPLGVRLGQMSAG